METMTWVAMLVLDLLIVTDRIGASSVPLTARQLLFSDPVSPSLSNPHKETVRNRDRQGSPRTAKTFETSGKSGRPFDLIAQHFEARS